MICANCGQETDDLYTCDTCGNETCEDCSVSEGDRIDDIRMVCVSCFDERK